MARSKTFSARLHIQKISYLCKFYSRHINQKNKKNMTTTLCFLNGLGTSEIIIIALLVLLLFGGKKIPELMRGIGKGMRSFKEGMKEVEDEISLDPPKSKIEK